MSEAWRDEDWTADELAFDEELQVRLRASLDVAGPSEEAEERMLANLLAAQGARESKERAEGSAAAEPVTIEPIELPSVTVVEGGKHGQAPKRRRRFALAAAAALVAALAGVGMLSSMNAAPKDGALMATSAYDNSAATSEAEEYAGEAASAGASEVADAVVSLRAGEGVEEAEAAPEAAAPAEDFLAMGGAFDVSGDPSYEFAVTYPEVRLYTGETLRVEEHDGGPVIIEEEWVEQLVGEAEAFTEDGSDSVGCWVYSLPVSDDGLYVVRYLEDGSCFAIRVVE